MKALIFLAILITFGLIFFKYSREKNIKKLFLSLITFGVIIALAVVGNLTRPVLPIYLAHLFLIVIAWAALMLYIFKHKYYWWIVLSPLLTIALFLVLELLTGSSHEIM